MLADENSQMSEALRTIQQEKIVEAEEFNRKQQKITNDQMEAIKKLENQLIVEKEDNNMKKEKIEQLENLTKKLEQDAKKFNDEITQVLLQIQKEAK